MVFNPSFDIDDFQKEYYVYKNIYGEITKQHKSDYFIRKNLLNKTQNKVNFYIKNYTN